MRNALIGTDGVGAASVFLEPCMASVTFDPELVTVDDLRAAVARAGWESAHTYRVARATLRVETRP